MIYKMQRRRRKIITAIIIMMFFFAISARYDGNLENPILNKMIHASLKDVTLPDVSILGVDVSEVQLPDLSLHWFMSFFHKPVTLATEIRKSVEETMQCRGQRKGTSDDVAQNMEKNSLDAEMVEDKAVETGQSFFDRCLDIVDNKYNNAQAIEHFLRTLEKDKKK